MDLGDGARLPLDEEAMLDRLKHRFRNHVPQQPAYRHCRSGRDEPGSFLSGNDLHLLGSPCHRCISRSAPEDRNNRRRRAERAAHRGDDAAANVRQLARSGSPRQLDEGFCNLPHSRRSCLEPRAE